MMNAWRYFVVVVLVIIVAHELPAQSGPRLDPMMAGDNTVSLTVPRTDYILSRLAPESKLFESDSGRIIFDRSGYWFFLNLDENVIVQIENKSARWKRFLERVLFVDTPGRVYRSLTTELE
ncbi:MAG: hypothetical protein OEV68_08375, partial [candidate division Zixibacteria bacterium]|nr:hypothetical protein [candidate division Zixibacteria bacterium]